MQRSGKDCQLKESNFINECERWRALEKETENLWKEIREKVKTSTRKNLRTVKNWKLGKRICYSREWNEKKREVRKILRKIVMGQSQKEEYTKVVKEYKL